jgi:hypothetical protein
MTTLPYARSDAPHRNGRRGQSKEDHFEAVSGIPPASEPVQMRPSTQRRLKREVLTPCRQPFDFRDENTPRCNSRSLRS